MSPLPSPPRQPWGACGFKYGTGECVVLFIHQEKGALVLVLNPLGRVWVAATTKGAFGSHHTTKGVCFVVYITEYGAWVSGQPIKGCVGLTESPKRVRLVFVAPAGCVRLSYAPIRVRLVYKGQLGATFGSRDRTRVRLV
ncbi:hypothetical protein Tco_0324720 [Tanacetum coccineum]